MNLSFKATFICNRCKSNFTIEAIYFLDKSAVKCPYCGKDFSEEHTKLLLEGIKKLQDLKTLQKDNSIKIENLDFRFHNQ